MIPLGGLGITWFQMEDSLYAPSLSWFVIIKHTSLPWTEYSESFQLTMDRNRRNSKNKIDISIVLRRVP